MIHIKISPLTFREDLHQKQKMAKKIFADLITRPTRTHTLQAALTEFVMQELNVQFKHQIKRII